eukprot:319707-Rhodomonas_salina.3
MTGAELRSPETRGGVMDKRIAAHRDVGSERPSGALQVKTIFKARFQTPSHSLSCLAQALAAQGRALCGETTS